MEKRWHKLDAEAVAATNLTEMMYLKRQAGQTSEDAAMRLCLGRQLLPPSSPDSNLDAAAHIKVGSYYEIDHSKLPHKTPDQLKLVRVIMVSKKSKCSVSLRYPSVCSLRAYFSERNRRKLEAKMLPSLDEQYAMGSELAGDVLYRRIPPHEIATQRNQWSFWVVVFPREQETGKNPSSIPSPSPSIITSYVNVVSKKGLCWSVLKSTGMVRWGRRRQVRFLGRHVEERRELNLSGRVKGEEEEKRNEVDEEKEEEEEDDDDEGEEEEKEIRVSDEENSETDKRKSCKRKRHGASHRTQMPKRAKHEKQNQQITLYKPGKRREVKNSIERWSVQRYNLAEENMLKIMKEKGAIFGNPILRPALRAEARKLIGDTGLLDHLLKHMAGKVAPGGEERFMRRHNSDGAMEYWLESADLMDIRKAAGVQDPYWTPPPGWKLGDNPTLDPVCARELKELREEIARLKKDMLENKKPEEDLVLVTTPNYSVASQNLVHDTTMLFPMKEKYVDLMNRKAKLEEQLAEIAQSLCGLEGEMGKLKSIVEDLNKPESAETTLLIMRSTTPPLSTGRETKEMEKSNKAVLVISDEEEKDSSAAGKTSAVPRTTRNTVTTEDKAAKIERLKSGFRICKPQGTFLWPNMALSGQVVVPLDDQLAIPTPPSVCSSTTTASRLVPSPQEHRPQPTSTVKPLAERRSTVAAVNFSPTAVSRHPPPLPLEATTAQYANSSITPDTTSITTKTTFINLNEVPGNPHDHGFCGSHSQSQTSPSPLTYQRRHLHLTTSTSMPRLMPGKRENEMSQWDGGNHQQQKGCSSPSYHCVSVGAGTWLALSTPSSSMDNNSTRV
ncbi:SWITCH1, putative [Theobroma cacao]|uniref:SWITCH1, putative n=1 Tax=Theobroma cacao TaxID=3641 RepID=A0A061FZY7_THECC|nr:SWITCH1, putative [Theobroma cacao]